jgi:hypothetical protein
MSIAITTHAQTSQGLITGRVTDDVDRQPLSAHVTAVHTSSGAVFNALTGPSGYYVLPLLPPGLYTLSAEVPKYRPARIENVDVPVGAFVTQDVSLRLLTDIWQRQYARRSFSRDGKTVLPFYGPDVDTSRSVFVEQATSVKSDIAPSLSYVVSQDLIDNLPLAGRDVYELLTLEPGVTNDLATLRGIGVSTNGQRPSSGSFLLDGLDNNNYLISGPYATLVPEAIGEYRISTNNFSAEYGRTSGFLANAVTRAGADAWHGLGYEYIMNEALNANDFSRNMTGDGRLPLRDFEQGIRVSGPAIRDRLFITAFAEFAQDRTWDDAQSFNLPTTTFIASLPPSIAANLLNRFKLPVPVEGPGDTAAVYLRPPHTNDRAIGLGRIDWLPSARDRWSGRFLVERQWVPDFIWSPYAGFNSTFQQNTYSASLSETRSWTPIITSEIRGGISRDLIGWDKPQPQIPYPSVPNVTLPGSPGAYFFTSHGTSGELSGNVLFDTHRHFVKVGSGVLWRAVQSSFTPPGTADSIQFANLQNFVADVPTGAQFAAARNAALAGSYGDPQINRDYRYSQAFLFAQDSIRVNDRLLVHLGVRYDSLGPPLNTGSEKDWLIQLGSGSSFPARLVGATLPPPPSGNQQLYSADRNDWAARTGIAWNLSSDGTSILRAGYGIYYDRPFDNLWMNVRFNNAVRATAPLPAGVDYLTTSISTLVANSPVNGYFQDYPLTLYQPGIRTPYVQSYFLGLEHRIGANWLLRGAYAGSVGRKLLTTDLVNRTNSTCLVFQVSSGFCRYSDSLNNDIDYRANQGSSSYNALIISADYRFHRGELHAAYTLSHSIDNQSEPLAGGISANLEVVSFNSALISPRPAGFTEQFNSSLDRGNSDFDQRHTAVVYSVWELPQAGSHGWLSGLTKHWRIAQLAAIRSGLPYTIYASGAIDTLLAQGVAGNLNYNRANLVATQPINAQTGPYGDGIRLLNPASFADPSNQLGTLGRNSLYGPGLFNLDISLSRTFRLPFAPESASAMLRVDAYNVLNHANLNNPAFDRSGVGADSFAVATFGRVANTSALFSSPLGEPARQLQLMFRVSF